MIELAKLILYEYVYLCWKDACGNPTREEYGKYYLRKMKS